MLISSRPRGDDGIPRSFIGAGSFCWTNHILFTAIY